MAGKSPVELKPDIFLVIATLAVGGSERVCVRLANHWAGQGHNVQILLVRREGVCLATLDARVRVSSAEASRTRHALFWMMRQMYRWPEVPALLFGFDLGVGLGALKRFGLISNPLVYREGSCPLRNISARSHWKYRAFVAAADAVVAQSEYALRNLRGLGVKCPRAAVIWNPLDSRVVRTRRSQGSQSELHLLAAGRLSPEKGYLRLLDAVRQMQDEHQLVRLVIAGEGPHRTALETRINELSLSGVVRLAGFVPELAPLFAVADRFVLSSIYEGQPNVLLEALQQGCPVIAAGGEGVKEVLAKLDLSECWVEEAEFSVGFLSALPRVAAISPDRWLQASTELARRTDIAPVAAAYLRICQISH